MHLDSPTGRLGFGARLTANLCRVATIFNPPFYVFFLTQIKDGEELLGKILFISLLLQMLLLLVLPTFAILGLVRKSSDAALDFFLALLAWGGAGVMAYVTIGYMMGHSKC